MARSKSQATNYPVPQSDDEARSAIVEIGVEQRRAMRLEADLKDQIARLKEAHGAQVAPINARIAALQGGLQTFADANRARLTKDGRTKTIRFTTGELSWRFRPASVRLQGGPANVQVILDAIRSAGLADKFIRVKEEVNKDAMREHRDEALGIEGVSIGSDGEDFIVTPDTDAVEEAIA